jgi:glucoamylase
MNQSDSLDTWIDRQYRFSATAMLEAVSPVGIVKTRPGFGQTIVPKRGSIVASPVLASWDPDPDYFFHWFRDSAIVIDAVRVLHEDGTLGGEALHHFHDFMQFSLSLRALDGNSLVNNRSWRARTKADFQQYLRSDADLAAVTSENVVAETRVNPDGTLDISRWSRPQHDGPALRLIAVLRWLESGSPLARETVEAATLLIEGDIDFLLRHGDEPDFDMWEEERGQNYYSLRVGATALERACAWLSGRDGTKAEACSTKASLLHQRLDSFWMEDEGFYRSRLSGTPGKYLDISVVFAVIHAGGEGPLHGIRDVRILSTIQKLEALFDRDYAINHDRPKDLAPALGRYSGDVYFSGGAYYFSTLAAAEFYFRLAAQCTSALARTYKERGDAFLATVRRYTPESGELSEQFDQNTGARSSAKKLAWSYAAFITAVAARRARV